MTHFLLALPVDEFASLCFLIWFCFCFPGVSHSVSRTDQKTGNVRKQDGGQCQWYDGFKFSLSFRLSARRMMFKHCFSVNKINWPKDYWPNIGTFINNIWYMLKLNRDENLKPNCFFDWLVFTSRASTHYDTVGCRAKCVNAFYNFRGIQHTRIHTNILLGMCSPERDLVFEWKNLKIIS